MCGRHPQADTPGADTPQANTPLGRHPRGQAPPGGHPLGRHPPCPVHVGIDTPLPSACWDTHPPAQCMLGYTTPASPLRQSLQWTVRILLECILVPSLNANVVQTRGHFQLSNEPSNSVIALVIFLLTCFHRVALKRKMKCVWHIYITIL